MTGSLEERGRLWGVLFTAPLWKHNPHPPQQKSASHWAFQKSWCPPKKAHCHPSTAVSLHFRVPIRSTERRPNQQRQRSFRHAQNVPRNDAVLTSKRLVVASERHACPDRQQHSIPQSCDVLISNKCPSPNCGNTRLESRQPPKCCTSFWRSSSNSPSVRTPASKRANDEFKKDLAELSKLNNNCTDQSSGPPASQSVPNKHIKRPLPRAIHRPPPYIFETSQ